jgi:hypothetical protein
MKAKRNYKEIVKSIVETEDFDRARRKNDGNVYMYVRRHREDNPDCHIIWRVISELRKINAKLNKILRTKDWHLADISRDRGLYDYVIFHKDSDPRCLKIYNQLGLGRRAGIVGPALIGIAIFGSSRKKRHY